MWCPSCCGEYLPGRSFCPRCGVALTASAPGPTRRRLLPYAAALAAGAISMSFAARVAGTLVLRPGPVLLVTAGALGLLAHAATGLFVATYTVERARDAGRVVIGVASALVALLAASAAVDAGGVAAILGRSPVPPRLLQVVSPWLSLLVPTAALLFLLAVRAIDEVARIRRAATIAAVAAALSLAVRLAVMVRWYLVAAGLRPGAASGVLLTVGLAVHTLVWAGLLAFLVVVGIELRPRGEAPA